MNETIISRAEQWLGAGFDEDTHEEVKHMMAEDPDRLADAFYKNLEFGTGGLRGIMGAGTNRMNRYTVGMATQGLVNYLKNKAGIKEPSVVISYDCRINSAFFAKTVSGVLTANGSRVFLFDDMRPTPELSFAVRHLNCDAGIMITASHNPREYNGYKVYWNDGAQIIAPHDQGIIDEVNKIQSVNDVRWEGQSELQELIGEELDERFLNTIIKVVGTAGTKQLKIVYTPIHGTGYRLIPEILQRCGFDHVECVQEQMLPDGNFPTVESPNPEEPPAMAMAIDLARKTDAMVVLGSDPDADRVAVAARDESGAFKLMNGNQSGTLMMYALMRRYKGDISNAFICSTIVTTPLIREMAEQEGIRCYETLTGFKHIASVIREKQGKETFIGGCEESFGYMCGDYVRDKDAVSAVLAFCELAENALKEGKTLWQVLSDIYISYGCYVDHLLSIKKPGQKGSEEITTMMTDFRNAAPKSIAGTQVVSVKDYLHEETGLPKSNVIRFLLEDGSRITARPSGTEPKIKFYFNVKEVFDRQSHLPAVLEKGNKRIGEMLIDLSLQ